MRTASYPLCIKIPLMIIGLLSFVVFLRISQGIVVPLLYSAIIAIVLNPFVEVLIRRRVNRVLAIFVAITLLIACTATLVAVLSNQVIQFSDSVPKLAGNIQSSMDQAVAWLSETFHISTRKINLWINARNAEFIRQQGSEIGHRLVDTGGDLVVLVLIPVYIFMILYYQQRLREFVDILFKSEQRDGISSVLKATKRILHSYLAGLLMEALIIAILNSVCLLIIGVPYAILLGVVGALMNVVPLIGGLIAIGLPVLVALATGSPASVLPVLICYVSIQFIDNHFIVPKIVASKVQVNALASLVGVVIGGALWGVAGMFLAIPLMAICKVIFDNVDGLKPFGFVLGNIPEVTMPKEKD
jgi:predicted PurR-regulated permease PerM